MILNWSVGRRLANSFQCNMRQKLQFMQVNTKLELNQFNDVAILVLTPSKTFKSKLILLKTTRRIANFGLISV